VKLGVGTGVLGGFTTYSTFVMEALQSMQAEAVALAFGYLAASVVLGVVSARLGLALGGARRPGPGTDGAGPSAADHPTSGMDLGGDAR
jgi:CrcB protein